MMDINGVIWWAGAGLLSSVALLGAAGVIAGISGVSVYFGTIYAKRFGNVWVNLCQTRDWIAAGKPEWKWDESDSVWRMTPTEPPA